MIYAIINYLQIVKTQKISFRLTQLVYIHILGPVRRVKKQYLEDADLDVPYATLHRQKKVEILFIFLFLTFYCLLVSHKNKIQKVQTAC